MSEPASKRHRAATVSTEPPKSVKKFPTSPARAMASVFKDVDELAGTASFQTRGGIKVQRTVEQVDGHEELERFTDILDGRRGAIFKSSYEYPGRYNRWSLGFVNPPIELSCNSRSFKLCALNARGDVLLPPICAKLRQSPAVATIDTAGRVASGTIAPAAESFAEEDRSRQPSIFSIIREIVDLFHSTEDHNLGMYGSFGYDLAFQFEDVPLARDRAPDHRDIVMWLPDALVCIDEHSSKAWRIEYDFEIAGSSTTSAGPRDANPDAPFVALPDAAANQEPVSDHKPGEYADLVRKAKGEFMCGNLFECVPSQTFSKPCPAAPSEIFRRVQERNPAPFSFMINLGEEEFLVGASPEMFVRCDGKRVETCPISGTIKRGKDAVGDALQIKTLLNSKKDESELTMCTDVDRNDKSRICRPGSVAVIGRRQIEMYSRLIHTVDHVEGYLRDGLDAMDAFLAHTWAVTVTGAPKTWAMRFVEKNEKTPRCWYGGAVGMIRFDGTLNTGLTLRTIRIKRGTAQVRAGATLLYDSDPDEEETETRLKASAFLDALSRPRGASLPSTEQTVTPEATSTRVLLVDHEDSFVHTLANYMRQTGATVVTLRAGFSEAQLDEVNPQLVFLSPGPGSPTDFKLSATIEMAQRRKLPIFGVCLGLQGIVEHFGGELGKLEYPMHGKPSNITIMRDADTHGVFEGVADSFVAGRYHSLYGIRADGKWPSCLKITAETEDGVCMALQHESYPMAAVQFHPESIMTDFSGGMRMLNNVMKKLPALTQGI